LVEPCHGRKVIIFLSMMIVVLGAALA